MSGETIIDPWKVVPIRCSACGHEYVAVAPAFAPDATLECPECVRRAEEPRATLFDPHGLGMLAGAALNRAVLRRLNTERNLEANLF